MYYIILLLFLMIFTAFMELSTTAIMNVQVGLIQNMGDNTVDKIKFLKKNSATFAVVGILMEILLQSMVGLVFNIMISRYLTNNILISVLTILFSCVHTYINILAKVSGISFANNSAKIITYPAYSLYIVLSPFGVLLKHMAEKTIGIFTTQKQTHTEDHITPLRQSLLSSLLDNVENSQEDVELEEVDMMKSVLHIRDLHIDRIMTHRSHFMMVEFTNDIEILLQRILTYSNKKRIILWENDEDNIIGTMNIKDFLCTYMTLKNTIFTSEKPLDTILKLIQPTNFFISSCDAYSALKFFRTTNNKTGFVIDEYGTIVGMVTITDIFNEIVGEVESRDFIEIKSEHKVILEGIFQLRVLNRKMDWTLPEEHVTVAGLIMFVLKKIPEQGQSCRWLDFTFKIIRTHGHRIDRVLITRELEE